MKKYLTWLWLLNKRLYKKTTFLIILAIIPLCIFMFKIVSGNDSGILSVVLFAEDTGDPEISLIMNELREESSLITFSECDSAAEARDMVRNKEADAAWIFPDNLSERLAEFIINKNSRKPVINIIEREQKVSLRISHEKLISVIYRYCTQPLYINFIRNNLKQLDNVSDERLMEYYYSFDSGDELFEFTDADSLPVDDNLMDGGYLITPVRGLLSIVVMLCGLASAVFYIQDERRGTFSWTPYSGRKYMHFASSVIAVSNISFVMLAAVYICGIEVSFFREILAVFLYIISCSLFSMVLKQITGSVKLLCSLAPVLTVAMLALCPVFFKADILAPLQYIFPPSYYIGAIYNARYLLYMIIYIAVMAVVYNIICV